MTNVQMTNGEVDFLINIIYSYLVLSYHGRNAPAHKYCALAFPLVKPKRLCNTLEDVNGHTEWLFGLNVKLQWQACKERVYRSQKNML